MVAIRATSAGVPAGAIATRSPGRTAPLATVPGIEARAAVADHLLDRHAEGGERAGRDRLDLLEPGQQRRPVIPGRPRREAGRHCRRRARRPGWR